MVNCHILCILIFVFLKLLLRLFLKLIFLKIIKLLLYLEEREAREREEDDSPAHHEYYIDNDISALVVNFSKIVFLFFYSFIFLIPLVPTNST